MKAKLSLKMTLPLMLSMIGGIARSQVGINTKTPKVTMDVTAKTTDGSKPEGFMAPRLTGDQMKAGDAQYGADQTGAIVYATAAVTVGSTKTVGVTAAGYYYFDGNVWRTLLSSSASQSAAVTSIACSGATNNGTLTQGTAASGVSSVISYTGGNGIAYSGQAISSTGVTGLTATLSAGTLANGSGTLTYAITGTPSSSGTASFAISVGGQSCALSRTVSLSSALVSTFAGSGVQGNADGSAAAASFDRPEGVAVDQAGNVYVADTYNHKIRKITSAGVVTTFAGSGTNGNANGTGTSASFSYPMGIAVDASGNVYVADTNNNIIRKITPAGVVTTFAGSGTAGDVNGTSTAASLSAPRGVTVDASGNLYIADTNNQKIKKITSGGLVTTIAGTGAIGSVDGAGLSTTFYNPLDLVVDASGTLYVADAGNAKIRKIATDGVVTTVAGSGTIGSTDGIGTAASFSYFLGLTIDSSGNLYISDGGNNKIRKINSGNVVTTIAGTNTSGSVDGTATSASFYSPYRIAIDASGNLYISDSNNNIIRKITFP